jgi:hypothetical protein
LIAMPATISAGQPGQRAAADREQHDQQHQVVEAEPVAELDPAAVLVQQGGQRDREDA